MKFTFQTEKVKFSNALLIMHNFKFTENIGVGLTRTAQFKNMMAKESRGRTALEVLEISI